MDTIRWLLDSDPSIRWQVRRDLMGASSAEVSAERTRIATEGIGAQLLAQQAADGRWSGATWNRGWNSTMHALMLLREFGLDPECEPARRALALVRDHVTWKGCGPRECDRNAFFAGELEPCINGQVAAVGAYFGQDVGALISRLLSAQLSDGGWNCEAENGSVHSSFNTTICVLEALLEYERRVGSNPQLAAGRRRGEDYLLERRLLRRRSTGEIIMRDRKGGADWRHFAFPTWWHYDVLRGSIICAARAWRRTREWRRPSSWWLRSAMAKVAGGWRRNILARCRSNWERSWGSRAVGSRCAPCAC